MIDAAPDPTLTATVVRRIPLRYRDGADPALDRPAHVRAASGLTWWRGRLAVVSDDASFVGLIDPTSGLTDAITLPAGPGGRRQFDRGRGNKADKPDLEAVCVIDGALVGLGSDSGLAIRRAAIVIDPTPRRVALDRLYAALRSEVLGNGALNLEAVAIDGDAVVLGNRGGDLGPDGAPTHDGLARLPLRAFAALLAAPADAPVPRVAWCALALGSLEGARLRLTELEPAAGGLLYAATAEATTSAYDDGVVTGSALGIVRDDHARWAPITDERGAPLAVKVEGLARAGADRALATVDADDPDRPSELLEIVLGGAWPACPGPG